MSRGTGFSPAILDPGICPYLLERPPGRPDLHCVREVDHEGHHTVTPEFELDEESGGAGS